MLTNELNSHKVLVTGASKGIGMFTALHLARAGAVPILVARDTQRLEIISQYIEEAFDIRPITYSLDLSSEKERKELISYLKENHRDLNGIINNAGFGRFEYLSKASWVSMDKMIQLNVTALIHLTKELLPLLENNNGHIVNIASQSGKIATPKATVYTATKHAVVGFTNALRMEVRKVSVTGVNLGPVDTGFFKQADPSGNYRLSVRKIMLDPNEIAYRIVRTFSVKRREINAPPWMEAASKIYQLAPSATEKLFQPQLSKK